MNSSKPLQAAAFLDGRPGHAKQTLGILEALAQMTDVNIREVRVAPLGLAGDISTWLTYFLDPRQRPESELTGCDFLIGTGSRTHLPMLLGKKYYRRPVITCMSPAAVLRNHFDLCFVPRHDGLAAGKNIFLTNGPPNLARARGKQDPHQGLILVGGRDEKSHHWHDEAIVQAISLVIAKEKELSWTISSSPRTPATTVSGLEKLGRATANATFITFDQTGPGWIEKEYDRNQRVWVTADSMSMVFEALSAGCQVGLLPVSWKKPHNKFQRCAEQLVAGGYVITFEQWQRERQVRVVAPPLNEAQRCAEEILKRWWIDRLP